MRFFKLIQFHVFPQKICWLNHFAMQHYMYLLINARTTSYNCNPLCRQFICYVRSTASSLQYFQFPSSWGGRFIISHFIKHCHLPPIAPPEALPYSSPWRNIQGLWWLWCIQQSREDLTSITNGQPSMYVMFVCFNQYPEKNWLGGFINNTIIRSSTL